MAGRPGVTERSVVPMKPGNAGGGKGPQFKTDAASSEGPGDWATYQLREVFRNCRWRYTRKRRLKPAIASTRCTTRSAARTSWPMPGPSAAPTGAHRAWTVRTSRISRRTACSGGLANWRMLSGKRRLGHRQPKGAATDKPYLLPPRHISTLPGAEGHGSESRRCELDLVLWRGAPSRGRVENALCTELSDIDQAADHDHRTRRSRCWTG